MVKPRLSSRTWKEVFRNERLVELTNASPDEILTLTLLMFELPGTTICAREVKEPWPFWKVKLLRVALLVESAESQVVGVTKVVFVIFAKVELKSKTSDVKLCALQLIIETLDAFVILNATPLPDPITELPLQLNVTPLVLKTNALPLTLTFPVRVVFVVTVTGNVTTIEVVSETLTLKIEPVLFANETFTVLLMVVEERTLPLT